jgi:hypothetical protein
MRPEWAREAINRVIGLSGRNFSLPSFVTFVFFVVKPYPH